MDHTSASSSDGISRLPVAAALPLSKAVTFGDLAFISGQIPLDPTGQPLTGTVAEQTRAVMDGLEETLDQLGVAFDDVIKATVWLSDLESFAEFNRIYASYFGDAGFPARSLVQAHLAFGVGVEVELIARTKNHGAT